MALSFPSNPTLNQEYTSGNTTWKWDGTAWNVSFSTSSSQSNSFSNIEVGGTTLIADSATDTLTLIAGNNVTLSANATNDSITINSVLAEAELFSVAADDSTLKVVSPGETIKFVGGAGITTTADDEGNITITSSAQAATFSSLTDSSAALLTIDKVYEPAIAMIRVDNVGTSAYTMPSHYSGNNPTIYVLAGTTIAFDLTEIPGHPFEIQNPLGDPYNVGLVHVSPTGVVSTGADAQGKSSGTLYWRIPESISGGYRYQCQNHAAMVGAVTIKRLSVI